MAKGASWTGEEDGRPVGGGARPEQGHPGNCLREETSGTGLRTNAWLVLGNPLSGSPVRGVHVHGVRCAQYGVQW